MKRARRITAVAAAPAAAPGAAFADGGFGGGSGVVDGGPGICIP